VDVGANRNLRRHPELAAAGTAVILVSSELREVMAMSDPLVVMRKSAWSRHRHRRSRTETVMAAATGASS